MIPDPRKKVRETVPANANGAPTPKGGRAVGCEN